MLTEFSSLIRHNDPLKGHSTLTTRAILAVLALAGAGFVTAQAGFAQSELEPVASDREGALLPPDRWDCSTYVREYREFLDDGNAPEDWRFVGQRYRDIADGAIYDWGDWLAWEARNKCAAAAGDGNGFGGMTAVGIVGGLLVTGAIAAGGGGEGAPAKSPG